LPAVQQAGDAANVAERQLVEAVLRAKPMVMVLGSASSAKPGAVQPVPLAVCSHW
jgi:hypothetical protein